MGATESTSQNGSPAANEDNRGVLEVPEELQHGSIHSLAAVDRQHLLSGGSSKVSAGNRLDRNIVAVLDVFCNDYTQTPCLRASMKLVDRGIS